MSKMVHTPLGPPTTWVHIFQNPNAWHSHPVSLSSDRAGGFCIEELGTSQGDISLRHNVMTLRIPSTFTDGLVPDTAASFTVQQNPNCQTTGLGVAIISAAET